MHLRTAETNKSSKWVKKLAGEIVWIHWRVNKHVWKTEDMAEEIICDEGCVVACQVFLFLSVPYEGDSRCLFACLNVSLE